MDCSVNLIIISNVMQNIYVCILAYLLGKVYNPGALHECGPTESMLNTVSCLYTSSRAGSRAQFSSEIAISSFSET